MTINQLDLSRAVSHALRHEPWIYELELDDEGWATVSSLLEALRAKGGAWLSLTRMDLEQMIARSDKRRHELRGDQIRALYGHSLALKLRRDSAVPPERLFHGTSRAAARAIVHMGLKPMRRQYVHMSPDIDTARAVGERKDAVPALIRVAASIAHSRGVSFFLGNEKVWLAESVPARYLQIVPW